MINNYDAPRAIDIGRAHEVILDFKFFSWWVDSLGVPLYSDSFSWDDYEE